MRTYSLAAAGAALAATATTVVMAIYAAYQYASRPGLSLGGLAQEHLLHVLVLGVAMFIVLTLGFRAVLLKPIRKLESELYRLATGHPGIVLLGSRVRELNAIERAANLMAQRMELNTISTGIAYLDDQLAALRSIAREIEETAPAAAGRILEKTSNLEQAMRARTRRSPPPEQPGLQQPELAHESR